MKIEPIGVIYTTYHEKSECPIQPLYADKGFISGTIVRVLLIGKFTFGYFYSLVRADNTSLEKDAA